MFFAQKLAPVCLALYLFVGCVLVPQASPTPLTVQLRPRDLASKTYGELAQDKVPGGMQEVLRLLPDLTNQSLPTEVKTLRITILEVRDLLDIFAFAYSPGKSGRDLWSYLRSDLDEGYESLGSFQDLAHSLVEYNETDVVVGRDRCLEWKSKFQGNLYTYDYSTYLSSPSLDTLHQRSKTHVSSLFWGNHVRPSADLTGLQNMAKLAYRQLSLVLGSYDEVVALEHVYRRKVHDVFHEFRKLLRSVLATTSLFPEIVRPDAQQPPLVLLFQAFKGFGSVNDAIFAYDFYKSRDKDKAKDAKQKVESGWARLVCWLDDNDFYANMEQLLDYISTEMEECGHQNHGVGSLKHWDSTS